MIKQANRGLVGGGRMWIADAFADLGASPNPQGETYLDGDLCIINSSDIPYKYKQYVYSSGINNWLASTTLSNKIYVDLVNGNDSSGAKYSISNPYQTVLAAQAVAVSGDEIYVYAGTDTAGAYGKDGVKYYFENGYVFQPVGIARAWFSNATSTPMTVDVDGFAELRADFALTTGTQNIVRVSGAASAGSTYTIKLKSGSFTEGIIVSTKGGNINIEAQGELICKTRNIVFNNTVGVAGNQYCYVRCSKLSCLSGRITNSVVGSIINLDLHCDIRMYQTTVGATDPSGLFTFLGVEEYHVNHYGNTLVESGVTVQDSVYETNGNPLTTLNIYGNLTCLSTQAIFGYGSPVTLVEAAISQVGFTFNGNIYSNGMLVYGGYQSSEELIATFNGEFNCCNDVTMKVPAVFGQLALTSKIVINGRLKNSNTFAGTSIYLLISGASGAFTIGETITGGTSGASGTLDASITNPNGTTTLLLTTPIGTPFTDGETLTGGTSGQTATLTISSPVFTGAHGLQKYGANDWDAIVSQNTSIVLGNVANSCLEASVGSPSVKVYPRPVSNAAVGGGVTQLISTVLTDINVNY